MLRAKRMTMKEARELVAVPETFDEVFLQHHDRIYRLIFRIVGSREEAEDLTQETFVRLYDHFEKIELERVYHWLHRVAVNFGLKALRSRKRWNHARQRAAEQSKALHQETQLDPLKGALVRKVLSQLSDRQARLLLLHAAGFSYAELAEAVEVKRSSLSQLLSRARQAFERAYQQLETANSK